MTRGEEALFGELRSATQGAAEEAGWARVVEIIATWPDAARFAQVALPYLRAQLAQPGWAEVRRCAPSAWVEGRHPALVLADEVDVEGSALAPDALIAALLERPDDAPRWRALELSATQADVSVLRALVASAHVDTVRHLSLRGCQHIDAAALEVLASGSWGALRALNLSQLPLELRDIGVVLEAPFALSLRHLWFDGLRAESRDDLFYTFRDFLEIIASRAHPPRRKVAPGLTEEEQRRAAELYKEIEAQLVDRATMINYDEPHAIEFESFYDLME